jgi:hypothetical protein
MTKRNSTTFNPKQFTTILIGVFSVFAVVVFVAASQSKTQTQSNAAVTCRVKPEFSYSGANSGTDSNTGKNFITYSFRSINPNPQSCGALNYGIKITVPSSYWKVETKINSNPFQEEFVYEKVAKRLGLRIPFGESEGVKVRITPPNFADYNKPYPISVSACNIISAGGEGGLGSNCTTYNLNYIKTTPTPERPYNY